MKERPILFSGEMVRAILDGRKTQTRRVVKPRHPLSFLGGQGEWDDPECWGWPVDGPDHHGYAVLGRDLDEREDHGRISIPCPYGVPGDRLWVREAHCANYFDDSRTAYRADWTARATEVCLEPRWTPSIHMPRWASRITLVVESVRVERVQDITEEDALAEGVSERTILTAREAFARLWDTINAKRAPWESNPWVWVVGFRREP